MNPTAEGNKQAFTYEDFQRIRCGNCNGYLNCPPIMFFFERNYYTECGRCFNKEKTVERGWKTIQLQSLEALTRIIRFPCKNYKAGCRERRYYPQILQHECECTYRKLACSLCVAFQGTARELVEHYQTHHSEFFLPDGVFQLTFAEDFERSCIIQQNNIFFLLQVKLLLSNDKVWFLVTLLEDTVSSGVSIEFTSKDSTTSVLTKHKPLHKPSGTMVTEKGLEMNIINIKSFLKGADIINCKVVLNISKTVAIASELLKEIECVSCWEYMINKIYLCAQGHSICGDCKSKVVECPVCKSEMLQTRNLSLEKLIAYGYYPCKNHDSGCNYMSVLEEVIVHHKDCVYPK